MIADPQSWVALLTFLVTAVVANQLSERARRGALYADQRRREVEAVCLQPTAPDHGLGIDHMEQEMIFERFYRGKNQRMIIPGTGMGLPIAKAIVELHGGQIGLISQLGRGSLFYFSLPTA